MERELSILLVEDDPLECQEMVLNIETSNSFHLMGVTNNAEKAFEYVRDRSPDIIILDLELHNGYGNGLSLLHDIREIRSRTPIYVLVTTNNISNITHDGAREMGADFIMTKSQKDYCAKNVIDFLDSLKKVILNNKKVLVQSTVVSKEETRKHLTIKIMKELDHIGIAPNAVGRKYLIDGIASIVGGTRESLLTAIAMTYSKSEASVERAMQNAIDRAWRTSHIDDLERYYTARIHSSRGVPTIMEFMFYYAEKIQHERLV